MLPRSNILQIKGRLNMPSDENLDNAIAMAIKAMTIQGKIEKDKKNYEDWFKYNNAIDTLRIVEYR